MYRDLESDREVEHFAEPHTPAFSRLPHHTTDRRAPKFNMAPTNRAKSDRQEAIQRALEKREQENTPFDDLALEFGIPKTARAICLQTETDAAQACADVLTAPSLSRICWTLQFARRYLYREFFGCFSLHIISSRIFQFARRSVLQRTHTIAYLYDYRRCCDAPQRITRSQIHEYRADATHKPRRTLWNVRV